MGKGIVQHTVWIALMSFGVVLVGRWRMIDGILCALLVLL